MDWFARIVAVSSLLLSCYNTWRQHTDRTVKLRVKIGKGFKFNTRSPILSPVPWDSPYEANVLVMRVENVGRVEVTLTECYMIMEGDVLPFYFLEGQTDGDRLPHVLKPNERHEAYEALESSHFWFDGPRLMRAAANDAVGNEYWAEPVILRGYGEGGKLRAPESPRPAKT